MMLETSFTNVTYMAPFYNLQHIIDMFSVLNIQFLFILFVIISLKMIEMIQCLIQEMITFS